jgi:hypothetical protein
MLRRDGEERCNLVITLGDSTDSPVGQVDVNSADTILYFQTLSFFMPTPKRSGRCMRCNRHLVHLLDHIKKQHADDKFTTRDIKDSILVVCPCGTVVPNHAGLIKHHLRYGCVEATRRPFIRGSSPLTSLSSSSQASRRPLPSSSPLTSAPPSTSTRRSQLSSPPSTPRGHLSARLTLSTQLSSSPALSSTRHRSVSDKLSRMI